MVGCEFEVFARHLLCFVVFVLICVGLCIFAKRLYCFVVTCEYLLGSCCDLLRI